MLAVSGCELGCCRYLWGMKLDSFTLRHLNAWFSAGFSPVPSGEEDEAKAQMIAFLESLDPDESEAVIARGWTSVYDLSTDSK